MSSHSTVIVCTRNRADDVARLLDDLPNQVTRPALLVADSSDGTETEELVRAFAETGAWSGVRYLAAEPGLTRQRMAGVSALDPDVDIVHFVDDDVLLEPQYFEVIERTFAERPDVLGIGGYITNVGETPRMRLITRFFGIDSSRRGSVTRSGLNIFPFHPTEVMEVDWVSGCCMSWRREVFDRLAFDTRMTGYSLGEDVDLSFRASRLGTLLLVPEARMVHLVSPIGRYELERHVEERLVFRHRLVSELRGHGVSLVAFWWSVAGEVLLTLPKMLFYSDRDRWRDHFAAMRRGIRTVRKTQRGLPRDPRLER